MKRDKRNIIKTKPFIIILIVFNLLSGFSDQSIPKGLEKKIKNIQKAWHVPGMAVAIIKKDKVVYAKGFGVRELGQRGKVDEKTLFAVGSTTKAMTVATLGILVDEEKLKWDDRVVDVLPGFRMYDAYATAEMRVRDLLSHKSGLTRGDASWYASPRTQQEVFHSIRYLKPAFSFRSTYHYQNLMYLTAGLVSEEIYGSSWHDIMRRKIFKPLGMETSVTRVADLEKRNNVASPHAKVDGKLQPIEDRNLDNISPAGSVYSNAVEMANWIRLNLNKGEFDGKRILSEEVMNDMHNSQMFRSYDSNIKEEKGLINFRNYGLGWAVEDYRGHKRITHGGGIDGFITWIGFVPDLDLGWVVFNNGGNGASYVVGTEIIDAYLGVGDEIDWSSVRKKYYDKAIASADSTIHDLESQRVENTKKRVSNNGYVGNYNEEFYGEMTITEKEGNLILSRGNALRGILNHWHYDTFQVRWDSPRERARFQNEFITFHFNARNEPYVLERIMDGKPAYFIRIAMLSETS
ncbi:MAG: hypothetical protein CL722_05610 [Chloroflexi bacterium]|jgi:CubicO group peptidase (beta-lactamase class C family)|nr:hypothetical protein [Chloroflexota bacterium]|tara:strand:- start:2186 stop:3742 length:1557 start_codon:yes stop_codon:yes gene_type:complete